MYTVFFISFVVCLCYLHLKLVELTKKEIKRNSVHLVGPELNICITKMYGTTNVKKA
jgi:hypothetical protein